MTLTLTGWAEKSVQAFGNLAQDNPDRARRIVRDMSPADRAVLSFTLDELSRIVREEEEFRTTAARRAARLSAEGRTGSYADEPFGTG